MKGLENVKALFTDPAAAKIISTISADGELHSIVAGSVAVLDDDTLAFAEVFMKKTSQNLKDNGKLVILAEKGMESYLVNATQPKRHTDDEIFKALAAKFAEMKIPVAAVWTCTIDKIFNQGANPEAGTQLY